MYRRTLTHALLPGLIALATVVGAGADALRDDVIARRTRFMERLGAETLFIQWSAPERTYSRDVEYEYRQDSNLLYLTGISQRDTILVLLPGDATTKEVLFVANPDPRREHWEGHSLTRAEATEVSGIATVFYTSEIDAVIGRILSGHGVRRGGTESPVAAGAFSAALAANRARLALYLGDRPGLTEPLSPALEFAKNATARFFGFTVTDVTRELDLLRQVKTPYEQQVLRKGVEISSEAHKAGMRAARPGRFEYEVEAAIEHVYLANGAMSWGYPSIVASGPNATILHYNASTRRMEDGDLLLVDAAASYQGLTGDITRTYPVNGTFTAPQKDIYALVLAAQDAGADAARAGNGIPDIERAAAEVIKAGLLRLGLITDATGHQFRTWYTHGIVHGIGMDVHDVGDWSAPLAPGMTFTIEPGLYLREEALAQLPRTPENEAFIQRVRPAVERYRNIGVRIEDSFLLTEDGLVRLSASVPRTIADIEALMAAAPADAR